MSGNHYYVATKDIEEIAAWRDWESDHQKDFTMVCRELLEQRAKIEKVPHLTMFPASLKLDSPWKIAVVRNDLAQHDPTQCTELGGRCAFENGS